MSLRRIVRAGFVGAALCGLMAAVAACNVQPLYGTAPDGSNIQSDLAHVDVSPVAGRVGQRVRNELLRLLHGNGAAGDAYRLDLDIRTRESNIIVRRISGQPQGRTVTVNVRFELYEQGGNRPVYRGRVTRHAAYERSNQRFANDRAEMDAEDRAAREAAEEIRMRLSAFFASDGTLAPHESPDIDDDIEDLMDFDDESDFGTTQ